MTTTAKQLLDQMMNLDEDDRVEIADTLYVSVQSREDLEYVEAWSNEIAARITAHKSGSDPGVDWTDLRAQLLSEEEGDN